MLRAARRRRSPSRPRLWSGMALQAGARRGRPRFRPAQRVFHRRAATGAEPAQGAPARARAARDRGRHELQATHPDDAGLPPRRPAELRGARDAQPPGIRPGVLRERRGRARGREADGAPVKSQVYQLAESLGVPVAIRARTPTTDTYSLPQTQEEFFFSMPLGMLDVVLQARNE